MPIYEYQCDDCGRKSSWLVLTDEHRRAVCCKRCKSRRLTQLFSRFAVARSEESRLESLADPSKIGDLDESDPRSMARWMKRMGKELGEEAGEDFDQMMEEAGEEASTGEPGSGSGEDL